LGVFTRAVRNISRRKVRALLVIIAIGFCMAIMISIPAGITSNQASTETLTEDLSNTITRTEETINQTQTQIDCTLASSFEGFGFNPSEMPDRGDSGFTPPTGDDSSTPGQFGGGFRPGRFGGGTFGRGGTTAMNATLYDDISSVDAVAAVVPSLEASEGTEQTIERFGQSFTTLVPDYIIKGLPLTSNLVDNYPVLPTTIIDGRNLQAGDSGVVLLSQNNTAFFDAGVGDTIDILDQSFMVIGVYEPSGVEDEMTLYMNLSDAQAVTNNTGYITSITVFAENSDAVTDVANAISTLHPELSIVTSQQLLNQLDAMKTTYETALENAESTVAQTQSIAVQEIIVAVAATSLIVLFVMLYTVRERTKEIGTLKAIGFSNWTVMSQFMLEGVFLSLMAGVVGVAIASVAAPALSGLLLPAVSQGNFQFRFDSAANSGTTASMALTPELILIALGGAVLLGTLGSLYPAWRASRTRPAEAMRYE
jgi:putative ABC transport system permease protein